MIMFLQSVIADLEKQNVGGPDVVSQQRATSSVARRRHPRGARPAVKRAARSRRAIRRVKSARYSRRRSGLSQR